MVEERIYAVIDYQDQYVQPLLLRALQAKLPTDLLVLVQDVSELPSMSHRCLQWRQYESIDFERLMQNPGTNLANSFVIRKALIRKHYLSSTVSHWLSKHPQSVLQSNVKPSVEFEVDYAEFLDDALVEAYELKQSWNRNETSDPDAAHREWWILKPGMSDRGQGIRLFSSEQQLYEIFEAWDPPEDYDEDDTESHSSTQGDASSIIVSQLRHFVAQPYVHPPLLIPAPHASAGRKFHVRTYVLATGALRVLVYRQMLALFAAQSYRPPSSTDMTNDDLPRHLTNTCLQSGEREGSIHPFWSLPGEIAGLPEHHDWRESVFGQICKITSEVFEAAARSMSIHFQPLPNAFEIFGLDFLVDSTGNTWLLEVNAFPDFAQTGDELQGIISGLFEGVAECAIRPFFGLDADGSNVVDEMVSVLDVDLGRR